MNPALMTQHAARPNNNGFGNSGGTGFGSSSAFHSAGGRRSAMPRSCRSKSMESSPEFMGSKLFIYGTQETAQFV